MENRRSRAEFDAAVESAVGRFHNISDAELRYQRYAVEKKLEAVRQQQQELFQSAFELTAELAAITEIAKWR